MPTGLDRSEDRRGGRGSRFAQTVAFVVGVAFVVFGAWAFFAPRSFFDALAVFEPYNRHFIHDIGAFQIGLGAVLLLAGRIRDSLLVALGGVSVGATFHLLSHVVDRDIGGKPGSDIAFFAITAVLLIAGTFARARTQ